MKKGESARAEPQGHSQGQAAVGLRAADKNVSGVWAHDPDSLSVSTPHLEQHPLCCIFTLKVPESHVTLKQSHHWECQHGNILKLTQMWATRTAALVCLLCRPTEQSGSAPSLNHRWLKVLRSFLIYLFSSHSHLHKIVYELRWPKCLWDSLKCYDIILSEFLLNTMLANYLLFVTIMKVSKQLNASNLATYSVIDVQHHFTTLLSQSYTFKITRIQNVAKKIF